MQQIISALLVLVLILFSSNWYGSDKLLAESESNIISVEWEEVTAAPVTIPDENIRYQFSLFLEEGINGNFGLSTLEWLSLPLRDRPYQSIYLGVPNGYHIFSIQVDGDYDFNLYVFDQDGRIRDRREIVWGADGGSVDLIDHSVLQVKRFLEEDDQNGIEEINLQVDLNGQFLDLIGPEYIHPKRKFPQISAALFSNQYLNNLKPKEMKAMKNELLATHGYVFKDANLQRHFEKLSWYIPGSGELELTSIEEYNLRLLEQHLAIAMAE